MEKLKISLVLDLQGLMDVIESLPEGHSLLPYLTDKRNLLIASERVRAKALANPPHEVWCLVSEYEVDHSLDEVFPWCTCRPGLRI